MNNTNSGLSLKMDVADRIANAMSRRGVSRTMLAAKIGNNKSYVTKILSGDENLTLETIDRIFAALECRIEMVATKAEVDEWAVKRLLLTIEESLWNQNTEWITTGSCSMSPQESVNDEKGKQEGENVASAA